MQNCVTRRGVIKVNRGHHSYKEKYMCLQAEIQLLEAKLQKSQEVYSRIITLAIFLKNDICLVCT